MPEQKLPKRNCDPTSFPTSHPIITQSPPPPIWQQAQRLRNIACELLMELPSALRLLKFNNWLVMQCRETQSSASWCGLTKSTNEHIFYSKEKINKNQHLQSACFGNTWINCWLIVITKWCPFWMKKHSLWTLWKQLWLMHKFNMSEAWSKVSDCLMNVDVLWTIMKCTLK